MRTIILLVILMATVVGSGFWYAYIDTTCAVPVAYRIGDIDERFGTTEAEVLRIARDAEALWEDALKTDLFVYDAEAGLPIHFVFDERQENADREAEVRHDLEVKEGMSEGVASQYEKLISEFRTLKKQYESRVVAYEASLKAYNSEVQDWNDKGGAPADVIEDLRTTESELGYEQKSLEALSKKINVIVFELNKIGAQGNELIADYNTIVEEYNNEFSEADEFTQGDYTHDAIHIYQFDTEPELTVVLAHEFGHALSLGHVPNESSIMYQVMEGQNAEGGITAEDIAEYHKVCVEEKSGISAVVKLLKSVF